MKTDGLSLGQVNSQWEINCSLSCSRLNEAMV